MTDSRPRTAAEEWQAHWTLVLAGLLGFSLSAIASISLGTFTQPLEKAFHWTRTDVAAGLLTYAIVNVILSPVFGNMIDRWGPRRIGVPGVMLVGVGFALFGTATGSLINWLMLWVLFSVLSQANKSTIWSAAVSSEFQTSRGLALAITLAGSGVGNTVAQLYSYYLIDAFGWRLAYIVMGLSWSGVVCLVCYFFLWGKSDRMRSSRGTTAVPAAVLTGMSVREGLRSSTFAKLGGAAFFGNLLLCAMMMQLVPVLTASGLTRRGCCVDRKHGRNNDDLRQADMRRARRPDTGQIHRRGRCRAADRHLQRPADSDRLSGDASDPGCGASPFRWRPNPYAALSRDALFRTASFGTIYGFLMSIISIAVGLGPFLSGRVFDLTGSYRICADRRHSDFNRQRAPDAVAWPLS